MTRINPEIIHELEGEIDSLQDLLVSQSERIEDLQNTLWEGMDIISQLADCITDEGFQGMLNDWMERAKELT